MGTARESWEDKGEGAGGGEARETPSAKIRSRMAQIQASPLFSSDFEKGASAGTPDPEKMLFGDWGYTQTPQNMNWRGSRGGRISILTA